MSITEEKFGKHWVKINWAISGLLEGALPVMAKCTALELWLRRSEDPAHTLESGIDRINAIEASDALKASTKKTITVYKFFTTLNSCLDNRLNLKTKGFLADHRYTGIYLARQAIDNAVSRNGTFVLSLGGTTVPVTYLAITIDAGYCRVFSPTLGETRCIAKEANYSFEKIFEDQNGRVERVVLLKVEPKPTARPIEQTAKVGDKRPRPSEFDDPEEEFVRKMWSGDW